MRIVFDIDYTICISENRDYANAKPIAKVVEKIREFSEKFPEARITLHTSRGMASCNGNVEEADQKNRPVLEKWLAENNVPYDEIIFGKPLADIYVDDKGMSAEEFKYAAVERMSGFSGAKVCRVGHNIIKECDTAKSQAEWYERARAYGVSTPEVNSVTLNTISMEYIEGDRLSEVGVLSDSDFIRIICMLRKFASIPAQHSKEAYIAYVATRVKELGLPTDILQEIRGLRLFDKGSFCHGDFSLQNAIRSGGKLYLIDPSQKEGVSNWLLDAAKVRASLYWLDDILFGDFHPSGICKVYDELFTAEELAEIKVLEKTHLIRVLYFAHKMGEAGTEKLLREKYEELCTTERK